MLLALWPAHALAVGGENRGSVPTNAVNDVVGQVTEKRWYVPAHGGAGGRGADPDGWNDFAVSGTYYVQLEGVGHAEGDCTASAPASDQASLEMPAMGVATDTAPDRFTSLGGVVNLAASFWVTGYSGQAGMSDHVAEITITNCSVHVDNSVTPLLSRTTTDSHTYRSWITYAPTGLPRWSWGDGPSGDAGYGPIGHTYHVSSDNCVTDGITCVDVPGRGPLYVVEFNIPLMVVYHSSDRGDDSNPTDEPRFRAFPVREVESILAG